MALVTVIGALVIIGIALGVGYFGYRKGWCGFLGAKFGGKKKIEDIEMLKLRISNPIEQPPNFQQQQVRQNPPPANYGVDPHRQWPTQHQQPQKQNPYYTQGPPQAASPHAPSHAHTKHVNSESPYMQNYQGPPPAPTIPTLMGSKSTNSPTATNHKWVRSNTGRFDEVDLGNGAGRHQ